MAQWDSAYCLAQCKTQAGVPSTTTFPADADWYNWLTSAQEEWYGRFCAIGLGHILMEAPTLISTSDGGETYDMPSSAYPAGGVQLYKAKDGRPLLHGAYWDTGADYVWEGNKIRFPRGKTKTYTNGPYVRYVIEPGVIASGTEPTLVPTRARKLLVFRACVYWASRGGYRNPQVYEKLEDDAWFGDPARGKLGLLAELKMQHPMQGTESIPAEVGGILEFIDDGSNYTPA